MLNPIFSINHMRHMMPMFYDVGHKVRIPTSVGPSHTGTYPVVLLFPGRRGFRSPRFPATHPWSLLGT